MAPNGTRSLLQTTKTHAVSRRVVRCRCQKTAVHIGGGIGGLVTAGRLAQMGFKVTLLEKNSEVGGRCQSEKFGDYRFDTGPSLLLFLNNYKKTFESLGTTMDAHVQVKRVDPGYRVFFGDNSSLDVLYDVQKMVEQLEAVEAGAGSQYLKWLSDSRSSLRLGTANFIERDFDTLSDFLDLKRLLPFIQEVSPVELLGFHHWRMQQRFKDPRLQAFFTFQDLYVGLSPYNAPGVFSLLAASDISDGVWYPLGGFGQVSLGLRKVAEQLGVEIVLETEVDSINVQDDKVTGVTTKDGRTYAADVVVTNCDVPLSYELIKTPYGQAEAQKLNKWDYSCGVISYNWSVNQRLDRLEHHNVFLSDQYRESWNRARNASELVRRPNFYVHVPARTDPSAAPAGCDSVMVLLPVANMQESKTSDYSGLVETGREAILRSFREAGIGDIRESITNEVVFDVPTWKEKYALQHGAAFGFSHGLTQLALFRPSNQDPKITGLYFVGASARPGNGVPLVMIGADIMAKRVERDLAAGVFDRSTGAETAPAAAAATTAAATQQKAAREEVGVK